MTRIFISYSRVDREFVVELASKLRDVYGYYEVWFDEGLHGGDIWWEEILNQVAACDIFIYVLSNDSVQSDYCQAEFSEARRLHKQIITVQARDRTRLTDELGDIHYIDMKRGPGDADAMIGLIKSINKRMTRVSRRSPKPKWEPRTPKPGSVTETPRPADAPDVDTPTLNVPRAELHAAQPDQLQSARPAWWVIGAAGVAVVALVVVLLLIANGGGDPVIAPGTDTPTTPPAATTQVAAGVATTEPPTDTASPTETPSLTPTPGPTLTPSETLDPVTQVWVEFTRTAEASAAFASATAARWTYTPSHTPTATDTPTPTANLTATYHRLQTRAAATLTATMWTDTPTPTATPTRTPTATHTPTARERALALAAQGVTANAAWTPYTEAIGGVEMALVPAGCFQMGSEDGDGDEQPVHEVCFEQPFWIDVYEVTNEQYGSTGCESYSLEPDQPRNCVNWTDAAAFCEAREARLLTEAEWEYAARGPDGLVYPWGDEWDPARANWADTAPDETFAVGSFPTGASWVGALDLAGNVWEWVADWYVSSYPEGRQVNPTGPENGSSRVLRGGSWGFVASVLRAANRDSVAPGYTGVRVGFRCARLVFN